MSAAPKFTLDTHRMHDGIYCTLVLPQHGARAVGCGFGADVAASILNALLHVPCGPQDIPCDHAECAFARAALAKASA